MYLAKEQINVCDNLDFFARQVVDGFLTGLHKSPYHGFSVEFAEHRLYNPGDSVKNIDWKLFARSDRLFIKKFEDETNLRAHILIDTSSSMLYPVDINSLKKSKINKLSFSLYASACLVHLLHRQRDGVGLTLYNDKIDLFTPARSGKGHYNRLMSELDQLLLKINHKKNKKTNFASIISDFIDKIQKRSLIIIFSDMLNFDNVGSNNWFEAMQHLKYRKNEVILFHVQDYDTEKKFNFSNYPHEFLDLENNDKIQLNPANYKDIYKNSYNNFEKDLVLKCGQYNIDYVPAFIQDGFSQVLLSYLTKRSKIF